jgi:hypothetical protein
MDKSPGDFIEAASDPERWFERAEGQRRNARLLTDEMWGRFREVVEKLNDLTKQPNIDDERLEYLTKRLGSLMSGARLFSALALENALKGHLISEKPDEVEIQVTVNGDGEAETAKLKKIGGDSIDHDLHSLSEKAGLFNPEKNPVVEERSELERFKGELQELTHAIEWASRYPVPLRFEDRKDLIRLNRSEDGLERFVERQVEVNKRAREIVEELVASIMLCKADGGLTGIEVE